MQFLLFALIIVFLVGLVIGWYGWLAVAVICALMAAAVIVVLLCTAMSAAKSRQEPDRDTTVGGDYGTWLNQQREFIDRAEGPTNGVYPSGRPFGYYTKLAADKDRDRLEG